MNKKLSIAIIDSKHKWGGVATWNLEVAKGLQKENIPVYLFVRKNGRNFNRYKQSLSHVIPVKYGPDFNPLLIIQFLYYFHKYQISHVITNVQKEVTTAAVAAKLSGHTNIRRIGLDTDIRNRRKDIKHLKLYADIVLVPAFYIRDQLLKKIKWLKGEFIHVVHTGKQSIGLNYKEKTNFKKKLGFPEGSVVLGYIGQFSEMKRVKDLVLLLEPFLKQNPEIYLVLYGDGMQFLDINSYVNKNHLTKKIRLQGYVTNLEEALQVIDIGLLYSSNEGLPNTLLEYISAGIPQIVTDVGGNSEIVQHGVTGFICPLEKPEEFLEAVKKLSTSKTLQDNMHRDTLERFKSFSTEKMLNEIIILLNKSGKEK